MSEVKRPDYICPTCGSEMNWAGEDADNNDMWQCRNCVVAREQQDFEDMEPVEDEGMSRFEAAEHARYSNMALHSGKHAVHPDHDFDDPPTMTNADNAQQMGQAQRDAIKVGDLVKVDASHSRHRKDNYIGTVIEIKDQPTEHGNTHLVEYLTTGLCWYRVDYLTRIATTTLTDELAALQQRVKVLEARINKAITLTRDYLDTENVALYNGFMSALTGSDEP